MDRRQALTEEMVLMRTECDELETIKNLNLWGNDLADLNVLQSMPNVEVLSLSVNRVSSLADLSHCSKLSELYLRKNDICELSEVLHLKSLRFLKVLWLADNPCASLPHYRQFVLHHLPNLTKLDSQDVSREERRTAADAGELLRRLPTRATMTRDPHEVQQPDVADLAAGAPQPGFSVEALEGGSRPEPLAPPPRRAVQAGARQRRAPASFVPAPVQRPREEEREERTQEPDAHVKERTPSGRPAPEAYNLLRRAVTAQGYDERPVQGARHAEWGLDGSRILLDSEDLSPIGARAGGASPCGSRDGSPGKPCLRNGFLDEVDYVVTRGDPRPVDEDIYDDRRRERLGEAVPEPVRPTSRSQPLALEEVGDLEVALLRRSESGSNAPPPGAGRHSVDMGSWARRGSKEKIPGDAPPTPVAIRELRDLERALNLEREERSRDLERERARDLERERARDLERQRARDLERERARDERERARDLQRERARDLERQRAQDLERERTRDFERERRPSIGALDDDLPGLPQNDAEHRPKAPQDNLLCAVLALIKELDRQGVELVRRAVETRQQELAP